MPTLAKYWTLTMWPTHPDFEFPQDKQKEIEDLTFARYVLMAQEVCPKTQQIHIHVYCETKDPSTLKEMKQRFGGKTTHVERTKDIQAYIQYCKKDGNFLEYGKISTQGQRNDLNDIKDKIDKGATVKEIADQNFGQWCRNYRAIDRYMTMVKKEKRQQPELIIIYGKTGTGKTTLAEQLCGDIFYKKAPQHQYWDGYIDQECIIIDEFDSGIPINELLSITSHGFHQFNIKGSTVECRAKKIVIVSNFHPDQWYPMIPKTQRDALYRRVTKLIHAKTSYINSASLPQEEVV